MAFPKYSWLPKSSTIRFISNGKPLAKTLNCKTDGNFDKAFRYAWKNLELGRFEGHIQTRCSRNWATMVRISWACVVGVQSSEFYIDPILQPKTPFDQIRVKKLEIELVSIHKSLTFWNSNKKSAF